MRVRFGFPGRAGARLGSDFPASPCPLSRRESRIRGGGTAKATDDKGATTTSAAVNVVVSSANTPPTVSWAVLPATGTVGVATYLSATASDSNGSIAKVEFYDGATLIGTDTSSPYSMLWTPATPGQHSMTVRATDNLGAVTVSAPRTSTVSGGNAAPSVSLSAPSSGSVGVPLTLGATAAMMPVLMRSWMM